MLIGGVVERLGRDTGGHTNGSVGWSIALVALWAFIGCFAGASTKGSLVACGDHASVFGVEKLAVLVCLAT